MPIFRHPTAKFGKIVIGIKSSKQDQIKVKLPIVTKTRSRNDGVEEIQTQKIFA